MNANAYSLLNTVLRDRPCVDPSLHTAIDTAPFAILSIAQQCYYVLHTVSVTRALLYDEQSAYSQTVQRLVEKLPEENRGSAKAVQLPSQHVGNAILSQSSAERGSSSAGSSSHHAFEVSASVAPPPPPELLDVPKLRLPTVKLSTPATPIDLLPVKPACKLDISVAILGGGTVVRRLLHLLLDDHPSLIHPTRITVITRQPEKLNIFAAQGVMCLHRKHGTEALNRCHALIIACQPSQLDDVLQNHFSAKPYGNDPLHQVAELKPSTVVISCLAAYPKGKLAALLRHDEKLVVRTRVASIRELPDVAEDHVQTGRECMAVQVQRMADQDSFLKEAVMQAERHRVEEAVARIMDLQYSDPSAHTTLPLDLARRAALNTVREEDRSRVNPTDPGSRLRESYDVDCQFLFALWGAIQAYVAAEFEMKEGEKARKAMALRALHSGGSAPPAPVKSAIVRAGLMSVGHQRHGKKEAHSAAKKSEGPFLCAALATLPSSVHRVVVQTVISRYAPPSPHANLFDTGRKEWTASTASTPQSTSRAGTTSTSQIRGALRRLAGVYPEEKIFIQDLQEHYRCVIEPEVEARPLPL